MADVEPLTRDFATQCSRRTAVAALREAVDAGLRSADSLELDLVSIYLNEALTLLDRMGAGEADGTVAYGR